MAVQNSEYTSIREVVNGEGDVSDWASDRPGEALAVILAATLLLVLLTSRR